MFRFLWPLFATQLFLTVLLIASPIVDSHLHQSKDSLRDALDVLARKQRSLDVSSQHSENYYNPLRAIKYSDESIMDDDDDEEDLDFISMNNPNQLDDIDDNDFQRINDIRLVMDSLRDLKSHLRTQNQHRDNEQSLFRERERIGNHKRDTEHINGDNYDHRTLSQLFLDALYNSPPYNDDNIDDIDKYSEVRVLPANDLSLEMFQPSIYDKYKNDLRGDMDIDDGRRSLVGLSPMTARQMAMEYYPIDREYKNSIKRFPVTKRSGNTRKLSDLKSSENTDPEVAQDLKSLFGSRTMADENLTASPNKRDHNEHEMEHNHNRASVEKLKRIESKTDSPTTVSTTLNTGGQNEIDPTITSLNEFDDKMKVTKNKIKKSIDWSQYFGIDRRRKKTELLARPGTQEQDDEWLLQQYYKTIAENLRKNHFSLLNNENKTRSDVSGGGREGGEKRDKLEQMDERLKNVKNLIMKDAAEYSMSDNDSEVNSQEVKDVIMARLAAAYSLEKMRHALNDLKNSIALERPAATSHNSAKYKNNNSSNKAMNQDKRTDANNNGMKHSTRFTYDGISDFKSLGECPELGRIETSCRPIQHGAGYSLFVPCVMYKICRLCDDGRECANELLHDATRICENEFDGVNAIDVRKQCSRVALMILSMQVPRIITEMPICYDGTLVNSCLRRYRQLNRPMRHHNINDITNEDLNTISEQRWI